MQWVSNDSIRMAIDHQRIFCFEPICRNSDCYFESQLNSQRRFAGNGHNSGEIDSSGEIYRLSGELNQRFIQEMNGLMNKVSLQIQRATSEANIHK